MSIVDSETRERLNSLTQKLEILRGHL